MNERYVVALATEGLSADEIGGKGAGLAAVLSFGARVPETHVITRDAMRRVQPDDIWPADVLAEVVPLIEALLARAPVGLAVRSSAVYEDSTTASFAGVFESVIGTRTLDETLAAVRRCWASATSPRALAYLERMGIRPAQDSMAVLLQPVIPARAAGVVSTANPATGNPWQFVIHAVPGLAVDLMSGAGLADELTVDWENADALGTRLLGTTGVLTEDEVVAIVDVARALDEAFGCRVDMEWALADELWIVQARPLTALPAYQPPVAPVDRPLALADFVFPLRSDTSRGELTPLYADMSEAAHWQRYQPSDIVFTSLWRDEHDVLGRRYVDTEPRRTFIDCLAGPSAYEKWLTANEAPYRARWDCREAELTALVEPARTVVASAHRLDTATLVQGFLDARSRLWDLNAFGWSGPQALGWMCEAALAALLREIDAGIDIADLIGGEDSYTFRLAAALQDLARGIDEAPVLAAFATQPLDRVTTHLSSTMAGCRFLRDYDTLCWQFGKTPPAWRERPTFWRAYWDDGDAGMMRSIRATLSGEARDVCETQRAARAVRDIAEARVRAASARDPERLARFDRLVELTRTWTQALNDRHALATGLLWEREVLWVLGHRLVSERVIEHPIGVLQLRVDDLQSFLRDRDPTALRGRYVAAMHERRRNQRWTAPLALNPAPPPAATPTPSSTPLVGIGFGRGRVAGRARVIHELNARTLGVLSAEDILIVHDANAFAYADWHSLLMVVRGVVSAARPAHHLTQVAREIGVPVIGHVTAGLERITEGAALEIDASTGCVTLGADASTSAG